jgi:dihydrofolate reductase
MNRIPKLVVSRNITDLSAWSNSSLMDGELLETVEKHKVERDVVVVGSASVVHALAAHDLVDEYRILVFPEAVGTGVRLFADKNAPVRLRLVSAETSGAAVLLRYEQAAG